MQLISKVSKHGIGSSLNIATAKLFRHARRTLDRWRLRDGPVYHNPTAEELRQIENDLVKLGIPLSDFSPPPDQFQKLKNENWFPDNYHGGRASGVWDEKLLEHWLASDLLGLGARGSKSLYVDIAACGSPWAKALRERLSTEAYAIDLGPVSAAYSSLGYYRSENATATRFASDSVASASLQWAYEMFQGQDDELLIDELARILKPGGCCVIVPLYMHTHYCAYSTPEYFGKGYSDLEAKEYVRLDCYGVPSSRKYDATQLKKRVLDRILKKGMTYRLRVLRNKQDFGANIYCHFILEIVK